jgi:hypothetical protein
MTNETKSLVLGLATLGMLVYAILVMAQGLINGEKVIALRGRAPFRIDRQRNPISFWLYTAVDALVCVILSVFTFHFLSSSI